MKHCIGTCIVYLAWTVLQDTPVLPRKLTLYYKMSETPTRITQYFSPTPKRDSRAKQKVSDVSDDVIIVPGVLTPEGTPTKCHGRPSPTCVQGEHVKKELAVDFQQLSPQLTPEKSSKEPKKPCSRHSDPGLDSPKPTKPKISKSVEFEDKTENDIAKKPSGGKRRGRGKGNKGGSEDQNRSKSAPARRKPEQANKLLTDYFPVRRSSRMCSTEVKKLEQQQVEEAVLNKEEDGLEVVDFGEKGRGVVTTKTFLRGDFIVEYAGDLITPEKAKKREEKYSADSQIGCYMYYYTFRNKNYCVDATAESGRLGRLINHSKTGRNCTTKVIGIGDRPYLIFIAIRDLKIGEELMYDYGDRNKDVLMSFPWLST